MVKLIHTRPLAGLAANHPEPTDASQVVVAETPYRALANLRLNPSEAQKVKTALGTDLPLKANTTSVGQDSRCLWLGPDEWLIQQEESTGEALITSLTGALGGIHHSAKDVSHNYATIRVSGTKTRHVLSKLTPFDVHQSVFTSGQCTQTVMAKSSVIMDVIDDNDSGLTVDITLRRSFAAYVWERLIDAGLEFQVEVVGAE